MANDRHTDTLQDETTRLQVERISGTHRAAGQTLLSADTWGSQREGHSCLSLSVRSTGVRSRAFLSVPLRSWGLRSLGAQRCRPWRELTCHRECPPKPCCAFPTFPTCSTASALADARCVDGTPTAHSPKPSGWGRTPSAGLGMYTYVKAHFCYHKRARKGGYRVGAETWSVSPPRTDLEGRTVWKLNQSNLNVVAALRLSHRLDA